MRIQEFNEPVQPDTYEASMALNQIMKIGKHAIKLHKLIDDRAEMEAWVQKKIDLAGDYVKKVHGYMQGEGAGLYSEKAPPGREHQVKALKGKVDNPYAVAWAQHNKHGKPKSESLNETYVRVKKDAEGEISQFAGRLGRVVDQDDDGDYLVSWGDNEGEDWIEKKNLEFLPDDAYWNPDDEDYYKKGSKGDRYINDPDTAGEVPTLDPEFEEDAGEQGLANELSKYYQDAADGLDPEDHGNDEHEDYLDIARSFKKGLQAGMDSVNNSGWEFSTNDFDMDRDGKGKMYEPMAELLKKYNVSAGIENGESFLTKNGKAITKPAQESVQEDAGEGHMSKSTLYHTAKYAIELASMIKPGDDLEGWVQSKLNKAADYLQGAYNYEEYQKLNPYREELDSNTLSKHAQVVQKHIDEILARETKLDDIDTKPGMMRILSKRVNEVEKELAKENRKAQENMKYEERLTNKLDSAIQEFDTEEKRKERAELMQKYLKKGGKIEKVPTGKTAYKGKELKPAYKKDTAGTPITSPMSDESVSEDGAPFGSGMELLRMAIMRKFITVQEWDLLKHKWRAAADEVEEKYSDWPEGEGFGSSDHNFAIRDLMTAVGYEFDDQDTSGRFVVTKQPEEIEKAGIKNARMKGEPVKTEAELDEGLKDWAKSLAMAGIFVAGLAGVGSINDAINNNVPAIKAMNNALEMAQDAGNEELVAQIEKDLKDAKLRLDIGKDLNQVKYLQDKYSKFMPTEGLAYESKLAILLNQRLK